MQVENSEGTSKIPWDGRQYLDETDGADNTTVLYTNAPAAFTQLITQSTPAKTTWFHHDALGSMREATDALEAVTDTAIYDAWGNTIAQTGATLIPLGYIGQLGYYLDPETALIWIRIRPLQPTIARWTSRDSLWPDNSPNPYTYGENNPELVVDPSGQDKILTPTGVQFQFRQTTGSIFLPGTGEYSQPGSQGSGGFRLVHSPDLFGPELVQSTVRVWGPNTCNTVGDGEDGGQVRVYLTPIVAPGTYRVQISIRTLVVATGGCGGGSITITPSTEPGIQIVRGMKGAQPGGMFSRTVLAPNQVTIKTKIVFKVVQKSKGRPLLLSWTPSIGLTCASAKTAMTALFDASIENWNMEDDHPLDP